MSEDRTAQARQMEQGSNAMPRVGKDTVIQEMLSALPSQKPKPDSAEWWQQVAQGLGVTIHQQKMEIAALTSASAAKDEEVAKLRKALRVLVEMYGPSTDYDHTAAIAWADAEDALSESR